MPSTSRVQQRLMGMAYAYKKGELKSDEVSAEVKELADSMTLKQLKDFASTKHEGLPEVAENISTVAMAGMGPVVLPMGGNVGSGDVPAKAGDAEEEYKKKKKKMKYVKTFEAYTEDDINQLYGFYGQIESNYNEKKAKQLFDQGVKDLQKNYKLSEVEALGILNHKMGRKAADEIYDGRAKSAVEGLESYYGKSLQKEISTIIKSLTLESVDEALDINDPVLVAMRASKQDRMKAAAAQKERMKKRVYGKQREKLEDELWMIAQDLKDAYEDRRNIYDDMEAEAGEKGSEWSDDDANRYGEQLNTVDLEIEKLIKLRQEKEIKLAY